MKRINKIAVQDLRLLFDMASPDQLRKRVNFLFMNYLASTPTECLPEDLQAISEDIYFLIDFLDKAEKSNLVVGK